MATKQLKPSRIVALILFVAYLATLAWASLDPQPIDGKGPIHQFVLWLLTKTQGSSNWHWLDYNTLEALANVALYIPLGLGLTLFLRKLKWWIDLAIGVAVTISAELAQKFFLPHRFSTINDVIHNSIGVVIGVAFGLIYVRSTAAPRARKTQQG